MRTIAATLFLICAALLLVSPQAGYAYTSWSGCNTCHATEAGKGVHTIAAHSNCGTCHSGGTPGKNVSPSACIVCHPAGNAGLCQLINKQAAHGQTCLTCHSTDCAPAPTTTTTAAVTTTTTTAEPAGPCPAEAALGEDDARLDTLRAFRDQVLAKNPNGQKMIRMYYDASAAVVQMMDKDPALRESARKYLESIMPAIELMIKQQASKK
jgi:hypothetical protein